MPDDPILTLHPTDKPSAWRSPTAGNGLPLLSTAPLSAREREAIQHLTRALEIAVSRAREALDSNRVDRALDALALAGAIGLAAQRGAVEVGRGR